MLPAQSGARHQNTDLEQVEGNTQSLFRCALRHAASVGPSGVRHGPVRAQTAKQAVTRRDGSPHLAPSAARVEVGAARLPDELGDPLGPVVGHRSTGDVEGIPGASEERPRDVQVRVPIQLPRRHGRDKDGA